MRAFLGAFRKLITDEARVTLAVYRGSKIASRLANYFPERFFAYAFLAVGYTTPDYFAIPFEEKLRLVSITFSVVLSFMSLH